MVSSFGVGFVFRIVRGFGPSFRILDLGFGIRIPLKSFNNIGILSPSRNRMFNSIFTRFGSNGMYLYVFGF